MGRKKVKPQAKVQNPGAIQARYDAAGYGRRMRGWNPASSGPNRAIEGLQTIRNRARDASRNDWTGESGVQKWTTSLIGIGITPRFKRIADIERRKQVTDTWNEFVQVSDADGVLNAYGQQTLAARGWFESGEVFARRRYRRLTDGLPVPVQVQLIEAEFVPMLDADQWPGMPQGNRMRSGIEFDRIGRRVAYWMHREHPGEGRGNITADMLTRVPAEDVCHVYEPKRPGQLRGVPAMASVLTRLRNIGDYDDAVLERQKLANLFVAFITRTTPGADADIDIDPLTNLPIDWQGGEPIAGMTPGMTQELDPGQDVKFANPPEAGTMFSEYMRTQQLGTAAATGIPYELFSGDIINVSDRTLRVIINEFRRFAEQRQWQIIIPMFCQKVVNWFAEAALLAGKIDATEIDDVKRVEHSPHGWTYIHPVQDPQGKKIEVDAGFRSRSSVISERGDDPDTVDDERASDAAREKTLKLTPEPVPAKKDEPISALEIAQIGYMNAQVAALSREPKSVEPLNLVVNNSVPPTPVTVQNNLPPTEVTVNNSVEPTPVTVQNNLPPTEVTVNNSVEPTPVTVQNNVPPAEVTVNMPARKTTGTVTYDAQGNIISTEQIETDLKD